MKMQRKMPIVLLVMLLAIIATQSVFAQTSQTTSTVTLRYFNIQATYPAEALPGDSASVHVQANAKSTFYLQSLTIQVYYADSSSLHQITSATLGSNTYLNSGGSVTKDVQFTVPKDMPRTSLIAVFTENVRTASYDYYYYYPVGAYYYNYSYPYYDYYYYYPYTYYMYPSQSYSTATDDVVSPLSYVKATTPEYVSLQSEYNTLQQNYQQVQADNQKLQQQLNDAQNQISQKDAQIADLNQQLESAKSTSTTLGIGALVLVVAAVAVAAFAVMRGRSKAAPQKTATSDTTSPSRPEESKAQ
jgi:peptidoglycan hydrolase CwlO-like protein